MKIESYVQGDKELELLDIIRYEMKVHMLISRRLGIRTMKVF